MQAANEPAPTDSFLDALDVFDDLLEAANSASLVEAIMAINCDAADPVPTTVIVEQAANGHPSTPTFAQRDTAGDLCNLVDEQVRAKFAAEVIYAENELFTSPINTTDTMGGYLSGVTLDERIANDKWVVSEHVVSIRSNYGVLTWPGYTEPKKINKSNRGRKKQEKKKKGHKKQGTGEEFNSQISFHVRYRVPGDPDFDPMRKPYKFKVFRTGRLQLPGAKQTTMTDVFWCLDRVLECLRAALGARPVLSTFSVVMKNYKFAAKVPAGFILNLAALKRVLLREQSGQSHGHGPLAHGHGPLAHRETTGKARGTDSALSGEPTRRPSTHPTLYMIKYDSEDSKLSALFSTPTERKPFKLVRVKVFMRGKINILGAIDSRTSAICDILYGVFGRNQLAIFAREGGRNPSTVNTVAEPSTAAILARQRSLLDAHCVEGCRAAFAAAFGVERG